jgi:fused signal recognition particle receptor
MSLGTDRVVQGSKMPQASDGAKIGMGLAKTRHGLFQRIGGLLGREQTTDDTWAELEELLILADVGVATTLPLVERLREKARSQRLAAGEPLMAALREELIGILSSASSPEEDFDRLLTVVMVVGVNGSGKTTSIAKLARFYQNLGKRVVLGAADTFRAAAIDQLKVWGERVGASVIAHQPGSDPGAVVFDAIRASQESRRADVLILDTAGRLHTQYNLMEELAKLQRVAAKLVHRAPHRIFLVVDATTGQNAVSQARYFKNAVDISGVILSKLDSTAKGGAAFAIAQELGLPICYVGTGEGIGDFTVFDSEAFVSALFDSNR